LGAARGQDQGINYWKERLAGGTRELNLPTDFPRRGELDHAGEVVFLEMPAAITEKLEQMNRDVGVTMFMTLSTAFEQPASAPSSISPFGLAPGGDCARHLD
ncbi:MAG: hypothetical protein AAGJ31_14380, partial [Verrucomicrobiota bacterium]